MFMLPKNTFLSPAAMLNRVIYVKVLM